MKGIFTSKKRWAAIIVLAGIASLVGWQRHQVAAWYYVRQLTNAYEENRENYANKVADLDESALPYVLDGLQSKDAIVCANLQYALVLMTKRWDVTDPRTQSLVERVSARFASFSYEGQDKILLLLTALLRQDGPKPLPPRLTKMVGEVLIEAERSNELRAASLLLAAELIDCVQPGQWAEVVRDMADRGLRDERSQARLSAVQLLLREPIRQSKELMERAVPLLRDPEATVRRAALVALASESEVVREEAFLPLLHDEDAQVQYLCEIALRKRKLTDDDIKLARMISDKNPVTRMRVLHYFHQMPELNLGEWLRQLSQDREPAVRAAAVRAAADFPQVDLTQRLREMAERDPSETVRQNARYYLQIRSPRASLDP
jgi:hypothetical protein